MPGEVIEGSTIILDPRGDLMLDVGQHHEGSETVKSFRACSRTLSRASHVFDRMLYGSFFESKRPHEGIWTIDLPEDCPKSFELMARIMHGKNHDIPITLAVDDLYELTTLTHYYDCSWILKPWADRWTKAALDVRRESPFWEYKMLWIGWELKTWRVFEAMVRKILMDTPCSLSADDSAVHDLQMPPSVLGNIHGAQEQAISALLAGFREMTDLLVVVDEKPRWCRHATYMGPHRCESMILGSMTFCLTRAGLWPLPESAASVDISVAELHDVLCNLVIHDIGQASKRDLDHSECNPKGFLKSRMQHTLANMPDPIWASHRKHFVPGEES